MKRGSTPRRVSGLGGERRWLGTDYGFDQQPTDHCEEAPCCFKQARSNPLSTTTNVPQSLGVGVILKSRSIAWNTNLDTGHALEAIEGDYQARKAPSIRVDENEAVYITISGIVRGISGHLLVRTRLDALNQVPEGYIANGGLYIKPLSKGHTIELSQRSNSNKMYQHLLYIDSCLACQLPIELSSHCPLRAFCIANAAPCRSIPPLQGTQGSI